MDCMTTLQGCCKCYLPQRLIAPTPKSVKDRQHACQFDFGLRLSTRSRALAPMSLPESKIRVSETCIFISCDQIFNCLAKAIRRLAVRTRRNLQCIEAGDLLAEFARLLEFQIIL